MKWPSWDRQKIILVCFLIGGFFSILSFWTNRPGMSKNSPVLGTVQRQAGELVWHDDQELRKELVKDSHVLRSGDGVRTNEVGSALLNFENGAQIRLLSFSEITVEQKTFQEAVHLRLSIQHGDLQVLKPGNEEAYPLSIGREGKWVMASAYNDSQIPHFATTPSPEPSAHDVVPTKTNSTAPSDEEIQQSLQRRQGDFFKCYSRLLQSFPEITGHAQLSFTIPPSGHIDSVNVELQLNPVGRHAPSDFDDFVRCLKAVTLRQDFKPFVGPSVAAVFPLQFE